MKSEVRLFPDGCTHPKLKRSRNTQSTLVARFFAKSGLVAAIAREDRQAVIADRYKHHRLQKVFNSLCQRRPQTALRGFLFILTMPGAHNGNNGLRFR